MTTVVSWMYLAAGVLLVSGCGDGDTPRGASGSLQTTTNTDRGIGWRRTRAAAGGDAGTGERRVEGKRGEDGGRAMLRSIRRAKEDRATLLPRDKMPLFNGQDLTGWYP
jgi:hypothetical protein